jgi:hypothetical protein
MSSYCLSFLSFKQTIIVDVKSSKSINIKKIITLLSLTLLASFSYSQTFFNGGIYSNANWTLANSPYIITGNVVVFPGVTLNIEPGVEIRIKEGPNFTYYAIESRGTINMIGEPDALITVRADSAVTTV